MVVGVSPETLRKEPKRKRLDKQLEKVRDMTGLETNIFDNTEFKALPDNIPARTSFREKPKRVNLHLGHEFFKLSPSDQRHVLIHELVHGHHFNDTLIKFLRRENPELASFLLRKLQSDRSQLEGATELIARQINPEMNAVDIDAYPREVAEVRREAKEEGLTMDEIDEIGEEVIEQYRSIEFEVEGEDIEDNVKDYMSNLDDTYSDINQMLDGDIEYGEKPAYIEEYGETGYGHSTNSVGNINQEHQVPDSSSIGTGTNGMPESYSQF